MNDKDNKLIAEFMGVVFHDDENQYYNADGLHIGNTLQYHTSWDWLMPVIEKCYHIGAGENEIGDITHAILDYDIASTKNQAKVIHQAAVEFIKTYNDGSTSKEMWSELQTLKRILIDEYPAEWREIQNKIQ